MYLWIKGESCSSLFYLNIESIKARVYGYGCGYEVNVFLSPDFKLMYLQPTAF